jgi:lambda family phage minor tail protein L
VSFNAEIQKLGLGAEIILVQVDMTSIAGPVLYLTPTTVDQTSYTSITFGGQTYTPFPIAAEGFEWKGGQAPAQPTLSIANLDHAITGYVLSYGGLIGATVKRIRTYERFIVGGAEPDGNAHFPIDTYRIDRKMVHNDTLIQWQLASWIDQQGVMLPKRIVIRDYCSLIYRDGSDGSFDYSKATCPYTGTNKFTFDNQTTSSVAADICAHTLEACKLRFGDNANLPFGGFPGVPKFRTR